MEKIPSFLDVSTSPFRRDIVDPCVSPFDVFAPQHSESDDGLSDDFLSDADELDN